MKILVIATLSIAFSVAAQFALKAGMSATGIKEAMVQPGLLRTLSAVFTNVYILGGFMLYGLGAVVWLKVLSKWDVSKAYPLVGLGFAFTVVIGFLMGEDTSILRVVGVSLICAGVFLVGWS